MRGRGVGDNGAKGGGGGPLPTIHVTQIQGRYMKKTMTPTRWLRGNIGGTGTPRQIQQRPEVFTGKISVFST